MAKLLEFETEVEFVADINEFKDCLMSQDPTQENPNALWFNIDIPKGHLVKAGDRVRVTVEKTLSRLYQSCLFSLISLAILSFSVHF